MIIVTGGAGFIGSNVVRALNARGTDDVLVVDDLTDTRKYANLADATIADYIDRTTFLDRATTDRSMLHDVRLVIHQGACSDTTEPDGRFVMETNYEYTKTLAGTCLQQRIPLIYASSAAVYGASGSSAESPTNERPLNVYGWSKLMADRFVRRALPHASSPIVGLRYFNVYGPGEDHKDRMASIVTQLDNEVREHGTATIFGASHGLGPGQQRRDFVAVEDVVAVVAWFAEHPEVSGIFNCGTGHSATFEAVAKAIIEHRGTGRIVFRDFPSELLDRYQPDTRADLTALRATGYDGEFAPVERGIARYLDDRPASTRP